MSAESATILAGVIGGVCVIIATVFSALLAGIKDIKNRQFETIPPKDRYETFSALAELSGRECEWSRHRIKALYERMGMYFQPWVNEYLLIYVREKNLRYNDWWLGAFLKCAGLIKSENHRLEWSEIRYKKGRRSRCLAALTILFGTFIAAVIFLHIADSAKPGDWVRYIFYGYALALIFAGSFFLLAMNIDSERQKRARKFYLDFQPWLEKRVTDENEMQQAKKETESLPITVTEIVAPKYWIPPFPAIRRFLTKSWKT